MGISKVLLLALQNFLSKFLFKSLHSVTIDQKSYLGHLLAICEIFVIAESRTFLNQIGNESNSL